MSRSRAIVSSVLRSNLVSLWHYAELVPPAFARRCPGYRTRVGAGDAALRAAELAAMSVAARYELARRSLEPFDHLTLDLEGLTRHPSSSLQALAAFLGIDAEPAQLAFVAARQAESRGGLFSSFRAVEDVETAWHQTLSARQVGVIDDVMRAMDGCSTIEACRRGGDE